VNSSLRVRWPAERIVPHANEGPSNFDQLVIFVTLADADIAQFALNFYDVLSHAGHGGKYHSAIDLVTLTV
jgi:hypothetical protein